MSTRASVALLAALVVIVVCYVHNVGKSTPRLNVAVVEPEPGAYIVKVYAVSPRQPNRRVQRSLDGEALKLAEEAAAKLEKQWGRRPLSTLIVLCRIQLPDGSAALLPMEMMVIFIPPGAIPPPGVPVS